MLWRQASDVYQQQVECERAVIGHLATDHPMCLNYNNILQPDSLCSFRDICPTIPRHANKTGAFTLIVEALPKMAKDSRFQI